MKTVLDKHLIARPQYLNQLIEHRDVDLVKIITGLRRVGKSSLLDLYHRYLLEQGVSPKHILHINFESLVYQHLQTALDLYQHVAKLMPKRGRVYLLFDELQMVKQWERAIESFRLDYDVDIVITGSNSYMFSSEFSTLLSGRYVEIRMLPLSFREFLEFYTFEQTISMDEKFEKFLQFGGMPILHEYHFNEARCHQALEGIYSTIVLRDIMERNQLIDHGVLKRLVRFLSASIGSITSPNNIANTLTNEKAFDEAKRKVASKTIDRYIEMLIDAYFFYHIERYDVRGKQLLKTLGKNYICDIGFRNLLLGYRDIDKGHILENVVYLELLRRDYRVTIGKVGEAEIDFIAEKPDERLYIQVTQSMLSETVRTRELRPLQLLDDHYEKIVLSMDKNFVTSYDGIKVVNVVDWLLKR